MNKIQNILQKNECSEETINSIANLKPYSKGYVVFFTPRSGSSFLTRLLFNTGVLGFPGEWYNPEIIEDISKTNTINNINTYKQYVSCNRKSKNGVFGLEIAYFQLKLIRELFSHEKLFENITNFFYLYRDNFILQGISLFKAISSGVFHSYTTKIIKDQNYDEKVLFDGAEIKKWVEHIIENEIGFQEYFRRYDLNPMKFNYESLVNSPDIFIHGFANIMNVKVPDEDFLEIGHKKLPLGKTMDLYKQFIDNEKNFVKESVERRKELTGIDSMFYYGIY